MDSKEFQVRGRQMVDFIIQYLEVGIVAGIMIILIIIIAILIIIIAKLVDFIIQYLEVGIVVGIMVILVRFPDPLVSWGT